MPRRSADTPPPSRRSGRSRRGGAESPRRRSLLWRLRRVLYALLVVAVVAVGGGWMALNTVELPPEERPIETSFVCDIGVADGQCDFDTSMARLTSSEERVLVDYEDLPPVLVQAVLASEDRKFFDHNGIDPLGITRALYRGVTGDSESQQGGSTITQQYVKNTYLTTERTYTRKLKEAVLAIKLERELDKREILTRYLNEVYFGRGAYGVEAASRVYFGVGVEDLQLYQAAYLAGLIRAPERADASRRPEEATRRRRTVLDAMVDEGYVTEREARDAGAVPWVSSPTAADGSPQIVTVLPRTEELTDFGPVRDSDIGAEFWVEWARQQVRQRFGPGAENRGLRIYTTFDPTLQRYAYEAVTETLDQPDGPVGSLVAVDSLGRIRAMVGGRDYATDKVNLALGREGGGSGRAPGSTFKPFALAAFVEDGYSTQSRFTAPPTTSFPDVYTSPGKLWKPANYDRSHHGVMSVEQATWNSTNTVYAGIVDEVGPQQLADMATRLGVTSPLDPLYSLVLGTEEVSVLDMAAAYSTLARHGSRIDPYIIRRIEDSEGNVLFDAAQEVQPQQVVAQEVADTVSSVLTGVITRGTGRSASIGEPSAGKTGTTNDAKDAWFAGYTCNLTAVVWMGYETPGEMKSYKGRSVAGGTFPAEIWHDFMSPATENDDPCEFPRTDAGDRILNNRLALSTSGSGSSTTSTSSVSTSTTVPRSTTTASTTTVPRSTTTAPATTVPAPTTTAVPAAPGRVPTAGG